MVPIQEKPIPLPVRIELCRAGIQVIVERLGVRALHIKGNTVDARIRPDIVHGSDVDLIVDPRRVAEVHRALLQRGWELYSSFDEGSPFGHAQTYWHGEWGYIDLHRRFPGIGLADAEGFEVLWRDHRIASAAGRPIPVPGSTAQGVLLVLNAARGTRSDHEEAIAFRARLTPQQRSEHEDLIVELSAQVAASVVAGDLEQWRRHRSYRLWRSVVAGGPRSQEWWGRVLAARSPGDALRVILRAPRVNRSRLAHQLGRRPTTADVIVAAVSRLRAAMHELGGWRRQS